MIARLAAAGLMLALPAAAQAQAYACSIPDRVERPHPELPSADQPRRILPIGGYTLAITWAPQYCRDHRRGASSRFQCASGNRFGFTLHGLWPDGVGKTWPQYCRDTGLLSPQVIRRNLCVTPSAQLLQHEYAKHGTCMGVTPGAYFLRSSGLYRRLRYPDMQALSRKPLTAGMLAGAIARANPGLRADMMRITTTRTGWLDEVWLCLDKRLRYERCRANSGGVSPSTRVKIWRGAR